ncbi:MAG: TIGR00282 family metallophosphoesterase [Candidatus Melainabacteria bacterium]|nr:TIGR00282 family metallophosphoesterase [Candidatus Melainabacteria bacterium]
MSILLLGDVIGKPGRQALVQYVTNLKSRPDVIVANIENVAHGFGVTEKYIQELMEIGVDVFTGGNHTFDRKELFAFIDRYECLLRPANYPDGTPGKGFCIHQAQHAKVGILNLMGRVFMEPLESPFLVADRLLPTISRQTNLIIVDMHAEATSEKVAMGWYLSGRVSAVVGTHTHVQTADERILPGGTAYITDIGCCGPVEGIIGMERATVFRRLIQQLPCRFEVAPGPHMVNGVNLVLDIATGKAVSITRIHEEQTSSDVS